jgi:hypothetical protein
LRGEIANLTDAIAKLAPSDRPLRYRRAASGAGDELARHEAAAMRPQGTVEQLMPRLEADYRQM